MIWVHGGVHGNWDQSMLPFVNKAVDRSYVVITPDYRGSTGLGEAWHMAIVYRCRTKGRAISATTRRKGPFVEPHLDVLRVESEAGGRSLHAGTTGTRATLSQRMERLAQATRELRTTS